MIFTVPALRAVTTPFASTVAIVSSSEVKVTLSSVGSAGISVTEILPVSPFHRYSLSKLRVISSTTRITVTLTSAVISSLSTETTLMKVSPLETAVITPFSSTLAMLSSSLTKLTSLLYAFSGSTVAIISAVSSSIRLISSFSTVMLSTASTMVTLQKSIYLPSRVVTVTKVSPSARAVRQPSESILATAGLLTFQSTS